MKKCYFIFLTALVPPDQIQAATAEEMFVVSSNEYGPFSSFSYSYLQPGTKVVAEPHKMTTFTLSGSLASSSTFSFMWEVESFDEALYGASISLMFKEPGTYNVLVHAFDNSATYAKTLQLTVFAK